MKNSILIITILLSLLCHVSVYGQDKPKEGGSSTSKDSVNLDLLNEYQEKLTDILRIRREDSLKRVELELQLKNLTVDDEKKKNELENQLNSLEKKEDQRLILKRAQIEELRANAKSYPVLGLFDDTLFIIYSNLGSFSASERALAISQRVADLAELSKFKAASFIIVNSDESSDIIYDGKIIMSISENDALWKNSSMSKLALEYEKIIKKEITDYKSKTSLSSIMKSIGYAAIVLICISFLIFLTVRLYRWTAKKIESLEGTKLKGVKIKDYTLFDAKREVNALLAVNRILKWFSIILLLYIALPILFGIFPWTKNLADTLFGYIMNPIKNMAKGFWNYLPDLFTILIIIFIFRYIKKGIYFLKVEIEKGHLTIPGFYPDWATPTYHIIKTLVYAFMIILIFPYLPGSDSPIFQGVSVFLGFLFTFGSAGSLSNVMAGLVLTYMRLFKIGDRVKIGEVFGDVIEKSILVTRVRTTKNEIISIPNSAVMSSHTINYSSDAPEKGLIIHTTVTIGYDVPWKDVQSALLEAANRTELLLKEPKPFVLQTSLDDFYVAYEVNGYTKDPNKQALIYSNLHQCIQDTFNENGIEILSPHYRAERDGNEITIPKGYTKKPE